MKNSLVAMILLLLTFPSSGSLQDIATDELHFEVNRVYPSISFTKVKLKEAQTIMDLNPYYKTSWIKEYVSVKIQASQEGRITKAFGKDANLSREQKDIINMADTGTDISILVRYIPDNTLPHNDIKEIPFTITVDPERDARYDGGQEQLYQYLKENAIDKIPAGIFSGYKLAAVKFTIDEEGQVFDVNMFWSSEDEETDKILMEAICNIPNWEPAEYADGTKVKQEFVLSVGNMESCVVPLLNIRKDLE